MRKLILIVSVLALSGSAYADIQAPPGAQYNSSRKLGRALANIFYGITEIPEQLFRITRKRLGENLLRDVLVRRFSDADSAVRQHHRKSNMRSADRVSSRIYHQSVKTRRNAVCRLLDSFSAVDVRAVPRGQE